MPTYDYSCQANGRAVEVMHHMSDTLNTWSELYEKAGLELGDTPPGSPVARLATGGKLSEFQPWQRCSPLAQVAAVLAGFAGWIEHSQSPLRLPS